MAALDADVLNAAFNCAQLQVAALNILRRHDDTTEVITCGAIDAGHPLGNVRKVLLGDRPTDVFFDALDQLRFRKNVRAFD